MTNIKFKLIATLTTVAMIAPATGAQAATQRSLQRTGHFASYQPARHRTSDRRVRHHAKYQAKRSAFRFVPDREPDATAASKRP